MNEKIYPLEISDRFLMVHLHCPASIPVPMSIPIAKLEKLHLMSMG